MNVQEWISSILQSNKRLAIPLMTHPGIELSGYKVIDAIKNGEIQYGAIKAIKEKFNNDVAVGNTMMDLTIEAEAFGCKINFYDNEVPTVAAPVVFDKASIEVLQIPPMTSMRLPEYLKAARLAVENLKRVPVFAGCIGPVSLAGRLYDMTEMMTSLYMEPDTMKLLLKKCSEFLLEYILEFKKTGADGIIMAEPVAGLLTAELCDEFSSTFIKDIVEQVQDNNFLFVLHNCGNTGHVTKSMLSTGARALHFGNKIDIVKVLDEAPGNVLILGNLDPVGVFKLLNASQVYDETMKLLEKTSGYKNFIISTGCDTPPGVPLENVEAFFDAVQKYNSGRH
ncbi:MAG: uroporphyrinogen decarboxylase family protein [Ignavibacteriaceae bacterium]